MSKAKEKTDSVATESKQPTPNTRSTQDDLAGLFAGKPLEAPKASRADVVDMEVVEPISNPESSIDDRTSMEMFGMNARGAAETATQGQLQPESQPAVAAGDEPKNVETKNEPRDFNALSNEEVTALTDDTTITVNGTPTTFGAHKQTRGYVDYQKAMWEAQDAKKQLASERLELERLKKELEVERATSGAVFSDPFTARVAALKLTGASEEEALAGAAAATGRVLSQPGSAPAGPPKIGSHEYYLQDPNEVFDPKVDPGSYQDFFLKHVEARGRQAAREENLRFDEQRRTERKAEQDRLAEEQKRTAAENQIRNQRIDANKETFRGVIDNALAARKGIAGVLTGEQKEYILSQLIEAGQSLPTPVKINDDNWLATNTLTVPQINRMVDSMVVDPKVFPRSTAQTSSQQAAVPDALRGAAEPKTFNKPIGAGGSSASGGGAAVEMTTARRPLGNTEATKSALEQILSTGKPMFQPPA